MRIHTSLSENPKIKNIIQQSRVDSIRMGMLSVYDLYGSCSYGDVYSKLKEEINKTMENEFSQHLHYGLPSIENYWKNVGAYLNVAIAEVKKEVDAEKNKDQMDLL